MMNNMEDLQQNEQQVESIRSFDLLSDVKQDLHQRWLGHLVVAWIYLSNAHVVQQISET